MLVKKIIPLLVLTLAITTACGTSGPMASDDETALIGVVIDKDSYDRVSGATVELTADNLSATTSEDGTFTLTEVSTGTHDVVVQADGYVTTETTIEVEQGGTRVELFVE